MLLLKLLFLTGASRTRFGPPDKSGADESSIFTGDVVEGAVWLVTGRYLLLGIVGGNANVTKETEVTKDLNDAYTRMAGLGEAYAVVGNHDVAPVNSFPPAAVDTTITSGWAYDEMAADWTTWIGATAAAEAKDNYGSYSVLTSTGLRMISVNTNFWYKVCSNIVNK